MTTLQELRLAENAVLNSNTGNDWIYLSEGNKHLVFEYIHANGVLSSFILKINKNANESEDLFASDYISRKWLGAQYLNQVIHPIDLPPSFVLKLVSKFQHQRPQKRRKKHSFFQIKNRTSDDLIYHASLESNALDIGINTSHTKDIDDSIKQNGCYEHKQNEIINSIFTFDMKPKWMFLNVSPFINPHNIRKHMCRFAMHQQLKYACKSIQSISKYCPLSLLSNDINTIANNIKHLLDAKQTNFKIFHENRELKSYEFMTEHHLKTVASVIVKHGELFKKISMLQRLDTFDIKVIHRMWMELKSRNKLEMIQMLMNDTKILDEIVKDLNATYKKTDFTETCLCNKDIKNDIMCNAGYDDEKCNKTIDTFVTKLADKQLSVHVIEYLLASIFKDCQVLITIDFNHVKNHKLTVVDLNSKPMKRIENKWLQQDINIVDNFIELFAK